MALFASVGLMLSLFMGLAAVCHGGSIGNLEDPRQVQGQDLDRLRTWGQKVGEDLLRQSTGVDLSTYQLRWDPNRAFDVTFGPPPLASGPDLGMVAGSSGGVQDLTGWSMRLEQCSDLGRLLGDSQALEDLPFRMEMEGGFPGFSQLRTKLFVPLSWRDEFRAEASLPLMTGLKRQSWWGGLGLGSKISLRSDFRSRLGQNLVEAGLATDWKTAWAGRWAVNLDLRQDYGEGNDAASQWLRLSRGF